MIVFTICFLSNPSLYRYRHFAALKMLSHFFINCLIPLLISLYQLPQTLWSYRGLQPFDLNFLPYMSTSTPSPSECGACLEKGCGGWMLMALGWKNLKIAASFLHVDLHFWLWVIQESVSLFHALRVRSKHPLLKALWLGRSYLVRQ